MKLEEVIKQYVEEKPKVLAKGERYLKQFGAYVKVSTTKAHSSSEGDIDIAIAKMESVTFDIDIEVSTDQRKTDENILTLLMNLYDKITEFGGEYVVYITNFDRDIKQYDAIPVAQALEEIESMIHKVKGYLGLEEIIKVPVNE